MASVVLLTVLVLCVSFPSRAQDVRPHREYVDKGYCTYTYVVPPGSRTGSFSPPRLEEQLAETKEKTARLENQVDLLMSMVQTLLGLQSDLTSRVDSLGAQLELEQNLTRGLREQETRLQTQVQNLTWELQEQETRLQTQVQNLTQELQEQETRLQTQVQTLTQELQEQETRLQIQVQNLTTNLYEHDAIIKHQLQCNCERPVPGGDIISTTTATLPREWTVTTQPSTPPPAKESTGPVTENDCAEYHSSGVTTSGVYPIGLRLPADVEAFCDMDTAGGGWTVIQRRQDGSVPFNRTWEEYKLGFGTKSGEYWLGNENIHLLTNQKNYCLRIDLLDWNNESRYAEYSTFRVSGESDGYRLHISGYSGTAGDSMSMTGAYSNNGQRFSTVDRHNNAHQCSQRLGPAGWWFRACSFSYLNGRYLGNCGDSCPDWQGVMWYSWKGKSYSLKSVFMKIRP
ncbi:uncharacterized protein LOC144866295 [Branchiostoma floridae x Branchiostoma japonicum]